jgi:hypothetical protein
LALDGLTDIVGPGQSFTMLNLKEIGELISISSFHTTIKGSIFKEDKKILI